MKTPNIYTATAIRSTYDGILYTSVFTPGIIHNITTIANGMSILLFFIFGYLTSDTISIDIIIINTDIRYISVNDDNIKAASIVDVTGIGSPRNVFVGPSWYTTSVLYRVSLRSPHITTSAAGIIIHCDGDIIYIIIAGATPNETISASESMFSPNIPDLVLSILATVPSKQSNTTARSSSCADSMFSPFSMKNIARNPHKALAMDMQSAMVIIFSMFVSIYFDAPT